MKKWGKRLRKIKKSIRSENKAIGLVQWLFIFISKTIMKVLMTESQYQNVISELKIYQMIQHAITQFTRWHHMTTSYAEHKAFGDLYEKLYGLQDELMEMYIGINGRDNQDFGMKYKKYDRGYAAMYLRKFVGNLEIVKNRVQSGDVQNLIDEIMAIANKTKYLLTLS